MRKLFDTELLDIIPVESGFIYVSKETLSDGRKVGAFHLYDQNEEKICQASQQEYIEKKFGKYGMKIIPQLGDYFSARATTQYDGNLLVGYPDGTIKIFNKNKLIFVNEVLLFGSPACCPTASGRDLWFIVPEENTVINYSVEHNRVEMRISNRDSSAFCHPSDIGIYNDRIFVCNEYSYKIRCIKLESFTLEDYRIFNEDVKRYFRSGDNEYVVLSSGIYLL